MKVEEAQKLLNLCERWGSIFFDFNCYFHWFYGDTQVASMWTPRETRSRTNYDEGFLNIYPLDDERRLLAQFRGKPID